MHRTHHELGKMEALDTMSHLESLIAELGSRDPVTCQHARYDLVKLGEAAVGSLIQALQERRDQVRWEAAKALVDIASPAAAPALVTTLWDENSGIRWLAAEALIALGPDGVAPLLKGLIDHARAPFLCEGAHHVLSELTNGPLREVVSPVLAALEGPAPEDRAPVAAYAALEVLRRRGQQHPATAASDSRRHSGTCGGA